ncbi:methionine--tRNA ligase [Marinicella rhabdoformis]|uniref:methionine--tRNA ligase n=1 Tax=Marinicella rhabdoformis TaxID=2580566 RepID=UPI0012AEB376|nr:methionine--tRNA ligase [Marinicella rhabdoformis]
MSLVNENKNNKNRKILVTSALPYASGSLHLGHLVEHSQSDIWARLMRSLGHEVKYLCADDAHGTPIMLNAEKQGMTPEALVDGIRDEHWADLQGFGISYDHYHSTHTEENKNLVSEIYLKLKGAGHIESKVIEQYFDPEKEMFLPDRFVKGTCPKCGADDQYGDNCEVCGATYDSSEVKNPKSAVSGATPILKESKHLFVNLKQFEGMLKDWVNSGTLQTEVSNKLAEWFEAGLQSWDISRDSPYFGFQIPGEENKYFYVWMDAPVGYLACLKHICDKTGEAFEPWINPNTDHEMVHFIGKDILYFHSLFWPAMLSGAGMKLPNAVYVHGFLTVNGTKMSKSRGTFIKASTYLDHLNPDYLRYYFAAKLSDGVVDIDLSMDDFRQRVNSDLVGKVVNIASRCAGFIKKKFDSKLSAELHNQALYDEFMSHSDEIAQLFEARKYNAAVRQIMALADKANQYIADMAPWVAVKDESRMEEVHQVCSTGINLFRVLMTWLAPVIPFTARKAEAFLNVDLNDWYAINSPLFNHEINKFKPLMARIEAETLEKVMEASKQDLEAKETSVIQVENNGQLDKDPISDEIAFDDFAKIDLRIVKIVDAKAVEKADKLLQLTLDLGGVTKNVFAGIKSAYKAEDLIGKHTVMVANLAPRKMRFGLSEGMVLAAGPGGDDLYILEPHEGAVPGMRVK